MTKKKEKSAWYIIRQKGKSRWTAYQLTITDIKHLLPQYESKGPYKSLVQCLMKANNL